MMSGNMAQKQMDNLEKMPVLKMILTTWNEHIQCINCRTCNRKHTCDICVHWNKSSWKRLACQTREFNRGLGIMDEL